MCNAWNHSRDCRCGFGGEGHLGRSPGGFGGGSQPGYRSYPAREYVRYYTDSYVNPHARCPVCGAPVFFYQSPYGGRVYFDELGWPWPKHPCTDNSNYDARLGISDRQRLDRLNLQLRQLNLPTRAIQFQRMQDAPDPDLAAEIAATTDFDDLIKGGQEAIVQRRYTIAASYFAHAIKLRPDSITAWLGFASTLNPESTTAEQRFCYQRAYDLALAEDSVKYTGMVERRLERLCKIHPRMPVALQKLGVKAPKLAQSKKPKKARGKRKRVTIQIKAEPGEARPQITQPHNAVAEWFLVVRTDSQARSTSWKLIAGSKQFNGATDGTHSAPVGIFNAVAEGLRTAERLGGTRAKRITIISSSQHVVDQLKSEAVYPYVPLRKLLQEISQKYRLFARVTVRFMALTEIDRVLGGLYG